MWNLLIIIRLLTEGRGTVGRKEGRKEPNVQNVKLKEPLTPNV